jgi:hypothetical protein
MIKIGIENVKHKGYGIAMFRLLTQKNAQVFYVLDPATKMDELRCHLTHRICNTMHEVEAAKIVKRCSQCDMSGRTYMSWFMTMN